MTFQDPTRIEARTTEPGPAISWAAVIAGAFAAAALSLVLLAIGMAFGLSMVSPWETGPAGEDTAVAVGIGAVIFLLIVHGASSGVGGYIAGRLRARWTNLRLDETQFRDTAHGMLVWALSAVVGALMVACFSAKVVGGGLALGAAGVSAAGDLAGGAMAQSGSRSPDGRRNLEGYFVDTLFRPAASTAQPAGATTGTTTEPSTGTPPTTPQPPIGVSRASEDQRQSRGEIGRILTMNLANDAISPEDRTYVAQVISQETGIPQADAEKRVDDTMAKAKQARTDAENKAREAADAARKGAQAAAIWSAVALLVGAFCASYAAMLGGRARDL